VYLGVVVSSGVFFLKFSDIENMFFFSIFFESVKFTLEKQKNSPKKFPNKKIIGKK
jgi:hypothetical protein